MTSTWSEARHKLNQLRRGTVGQGYSWPGPWLALIRGRRRWHHSIEQSYIFGELCFEARKQDPTPDQQQRDRSQNCVQERLFISILLEAQSPRDAGACSTTLNEVK